MPVRSTERLPCHLRSSSGKSQRLTGNRSGARSGFSGNDEVDEDDPGFASLAGSCVADRRSPSTGSPIGSPDCSSRVGAAFIYRSFELDHEPVDVAPAPVLSAFERGHDWMLRRAEVLRGMLVLRIVAAAHVPAGPAQPKVHPRVSHGQALLTARGIGSVGQYEVEMIAV